MVVLAVVKLSGTATTLPWSTAQLKRLSRCIEADEEPTPELPAYDDVMVFFNELAVAVQRTIADLDWEPLLGDRRFEVTSRPKTIDTLRQKLQRDHSRPLPSVQDIAGVRFEAEMNLDEQDAVAQAIAGLFDHDPRECLRDLRESPHSGYRAVHVWLRFPARVEVQVRTHLQGAWANAYESAADIFGRDIRYGIMPTDEPGREVVESLHTMSAICRNVEETKRLVSRLGVSEGVHDELDELESEYREQMAKMRISFDRILGR